MTDHTLRMVCGMVLLRVSENLDTLKCFDYNGKTYPVVVLLNTNNHRIYISIKEKVMMNALSIAKELWGNGEGDERMAISPDNMYIMDARIAAEYIKP